MFLRSASRCAKVRTCYCEWSRGNRKLPEATGSFRLLPGRSSCEAHSLSDGLEKLSNSPFRRLLGPLCNKIVSELKELDTGVKAIKVRMYEDRKPNGIPRVLRRVTAPVLLISALIRRAAANQLAQLGLPGPQLGLPGLDS